MKVAVRTHLDHAMNQAAFDGGAAAIEDTKDVFDAANNEGCPLS